MRGVIVRLVCSLILIFGLVASAPVSALSDPQVSAGGSVAVYGVPGENLGPDGGMVSISSGDDGAIDTPALDIDEYLLTASAQAGYGILGAAASVDVSGVARRYSGRIASASASADFTDNVTFNAAGLSGQSGFAEMTITLSGSSSAFAGDDSVYASSGGRLRVSIGGEFLSIGDGVDTGGSTPISEPRTQTLLFAMVFGESMELDASLDVSAYANASDGTVGGSGGASALFANTGGVNGFRVFDQSMTPVDFEFSTQSGEFEFYSVVPEPSTALLMGLGLTVLASRRRHTRV